MRLELIPNLLQGTDENGQLASLRERIAPILAAWARASKIILPDGEAETLTPSGHADLPVLVTTTVTADGQDTTSTVDDFAYEMTDSQGSYWLLASGNRVTDANGNVVAASQRSQARLQHHVG
jgi:hypothetical protein